MASLYRKGHCTAGPPCRVATSDRPGVSFPQPLSNTGPATGMDTQTYRPSTIASARSHQRLSAFSFQFTLSGWSCAPSKNKNQKMARLSAPLSGAYSVWPSPQGRAALESQWDVDAPMRRHVVVGVAVVVDKADIAGGLPTGRRLPPVAPGTTTFYSA